MKDQILWI